HGAASQGGSGKVANRAPSPDLRETTRPGPAPVERPRREASDLHRVLHFLCTAKLGQDWTSPRNAFGGWRAMGKILASTVAAVVGVVCAGLIGLIAGQAPVFHWEMAGLVVALVAAVGGAAAGAAGAASGNATLGACAGALSGGALFTL